MSSQHPAIDSWTTDSDLTADYLFSVLTLCALGFYFCSSLLSKRFVSLFLTKRCWHVTWAARSSDTLLPSPASSNISGSQLPSLLAPSPEASVLPSVTFFPQPLRYQRLPSIKGNGSACLPAPPPTLRLIPSTDETVKILAHICVSPASAHISLTSHPPLVLALLKMIHCDLEPDPSLWPSDILGHEVKWDQ